MPQFSPPDNVRERDLAVYMPASGLKMTWLDATRIQIGPGRCRDEDNKHDICVQTPLIVDVDAPIGPGGKDTGTPGGDPGAHYAIWLLDDQDGLVPPALVASLSFSAPAPQAGYDSVRRVATAIGNPVTGDLEQVRQIGEERDREYIYITNPALRRIVTNSPAVVMTTVDASDWIPESQEAVRMWLHQGVTGVIVVDLTTGLTNIQKLNIDGNAEVIMFLTASRTFAFATIFGTGAVNIDPLGWKETI